MKEIKVSVIVPVYNVEQYLAKCLDSLVNQTLQEIEILVINDGSPDDSQVIIDDFANRYPDKIRPFIKENGGLSDARNFGVEKATGEYIGFVDSDDYVDPTMFEKLYQRAADTGAECVVCDYSAVSENVIVKASHIVPSDLYGSNIRNASSLLIHSRSYAWNKIYQREMYLNSGIQMPVGIHFEDSACVYNLMLCANKVEFVPDALYFYRIMRPGAITSVANEKLYDIFTAMDLFIHFFKEHDCFENNYNDIENVCIIHICARLNTAKTFPAYKQRWDFANAAFAYLDRHFPDWHNNPYYQQRLGNAIKKRKGGWLGWINMRNKLWTLKLYYWLLYMKNHPKRKPKTAPSRQTLTDERLRDLQKIELDIVLEIAKICEKHKLTFFLAEGSLLGAIRHHGFIPWDDDMDISMPRDDYDRFLEIAQTELPEYLKVCYHKTMPAYHLPFAKIISTEDHGFVNKKDKALEPYTGVFVDIFPLDETSAKHSKELTRRFKKIRMYRDMLLFRCNYMKPRTPARWVLKQYSRFYSNAFLQQKIIDLCSKYNGNGCHYMANFSSSYPPVKQIVGKSCYATGRYEMFEGHALPVPAKAETLLYIIYNNYMTLPPANKRVHKHALTDTKPPSAPS